MKNLQIYNRFTEQLPADKNETNSIRQVWNAAYSKVLPKTTSSPKWLALSNDLGDFFQIESLKNQEFLAILSGNKTLENSVPYAMCYGGHQFGHWAGQLGDGRAINLFELKGKDDKYYTLQLKGAGPTPYSRTADGLAVLRSSIREFVCSEAMYYLGVPTTRALSLIQTGDEVLRDVMYNGNPAYEKGAIVCRVAESFIRFGNFEIFAARNDKENLKKLADFTIQENFPHLGSPSKETYIKFFEEVAIRTADLMVNWYRVGFVHGVMNTDNMSILGLTIDFGPYGWLDDFNPEWTPNTTDKQHRRYKFGDQGNIALWNLYQLANALYPLIEEEKPLEDALKAYKKRFLVGYDNMMAAKMGIQIQNKTDKTLISELLHSLQIVETDYTIFFRQLAEVKLKDDFDTFIDKVKNAFYTEKLTDNMLETWRKWFEKYSEKLKVENRNDKERKSEMNLVNPKYIFRNYMAQLAIEKADEGDLSLLNDFLKMIKKPYDEQPEFNLWFTKRPDWARDKIGSSMLSCSS